MIVITQLPGKITIEGHAGFAPMGQDIVCAAVSALLQTFVASIEEMTADEIKSDMAAGMAVVEYESLSEKGQLLMDSFLLGVLMIANEYPGNVKIISSKFEDFLN